MALLSRMWASVQKRVAQRTLTAAERANLRAAVAIPAVYTASLGGHARVLDRPVPRDESPSARRPLSLSRLRALFG